MDINVLALAYLGDSIYEFYVREFLLKKNIVKVDELQKESIKYVSARRQAYYLKNLLDENYFSSDEVSIIYRARNHKCNHKPKNTRRLDIEVVYCYGVTGAGKTRSILDEFGDSNVFRVTDYLHPFDGYNCQEVIVFDEFRDSLPLKDILNYLDVYPIELCARYANKYACYNKVFIVSNWKLEKQYEELRKNDSESWRAFLRRIHKVKVYKKDEVIEFDSVESYFDRSPYDDRPMGKFDF